MKSKIISTVLMIYIPYCFSETVHLDFIDRCSIKDNECIPGLWQKNLEHLAGGMPELSIPPLDPLDIENIVVHVPELVTMKFDGIVNGFKGCIFESARTSLKKGHFKEVLDLHCNISIKGHYDVKANNTAFLGVGNEGLFKAKGIGQVKLDNLKFKFYLDFMISKDEEGVVKLILKDGPMGYKYQIGGPVVFAAKDIFLGDADISPLVVTFVNQNWPTVMETFGGPFFQKAMEIVTDIERNYFKSVPCTEFFIENLDQYALKGKY